MIEKMMIKTDKVGRIVIPKEIRQIFNLTKGSALILKEEDTSIKIEKIQKTITIDSYGRVLIPNKIREKYSILKNDILYLSTTPDGILIKGKVKKYQNIINKLKYIENNYDIGFILIEDKVKYISDKYKELNQTNITSIKDCLNKKYIKYKQKVIDNDLMLYIIYNHEEDNLIKLIYNII